MSDQSQDPVPSLGSQEPETSTPTNELILGQQGESTRGDYEKLIDELSSRPSRANRSATVSDAKDPGIGL